MAKTIRKQHSEIQKVHSETISLGHADNQINKMKSFWVWLKSLKRKVKGDGTKFVKKLKL